MRFISPAFHQVLDFVTVALFAGAPSVLGLTGLAATLAYILAGVHLAMTVLTRFSQTSGRPVALPLHGAVEGVVGVALLVAPWLLRWSGTPRTFYMVAGAVILVLCALSQYGVTGPHATAK